MMGVTPRLAGDAMPLTHCPNGHPLEDPDAPCPHCASTVDEATVLPQTVTENATTDRPGRVVPEGYELLGELGRGGMGVVYKARQQALNRLVALKMILVGAHASGTAVDRFLGEAAAIASLDHPHIVQVFEFGRLDDVPFFSLEFCPGGSLDRKLGGTPLPAREAARLTLLVAQAMQYAHEHGIVHRDLKPANILLTEEGSPKVSDFGLAKRLDEESGVTPTGALMGTPSYMAPEQAEGRTREVGPLADVWALGAILYECLTGRPPFKGATYPETLTQVLRQEPVPPRRLNPGVPHDLEVICLKCLEKEQGRRYASAAALADDLDAFLDGRPIKARPVGTLEQALKWSRRNPVVAGLLAAVLFTLTAGIAVSLYFAFDAAEQARQAKESARLAGLSEEDAKQKAALAKEKEGEAKKSAADATRSAGIAEVKAEEARLQKKEAEQKTVEAQHQTRRAEAGRHAALMQQALAAWQAHDLFEAGRLLTESPVEYRTGWEYGFLQQALRRKALPLLGHRGPISTLAFSADGNLLLSTDYSGACKVWDARSGEERVTLRANGADMVRGAALAADGNRAVTAEEPDRYTLWDTRTGRPLKVWAGPRVGPGTVLFLERDGQTLHLAGWSDQARGPALVRCNAETGQITRTIPVPQGTAFDFDGRFLRAAGLLGGNIVLWDLITGQEVGRIPIPRGSPQRLRFRPDGRALALVHQHATVSIWDLESRRELVRCVVPEYHDIQCLAFSPDGARLASGESLGTGTVWESATGRVLAELHGHVLATTAVAFSPDGTCLASGGMDHTIRLWNLHSRVETLHNPAQPGVRKPMAVSPDGQRIAVLAPDSSLRILDAEDEREICRLPLPTKCHEVSFSPDGGILANLDDRTLRLWSATGEERHTFRGDINVFSVTTFSQDGKLLVASDPTGLLFVWDTTTGKQRSRTRLDPRPTHLTLSPDGQRLFAADYEGQVRVFSLSFGLTVRRFPAHVGPINCLALSTDGTTLATAGREGTIKVWNAVGGQFRTTLRAVGEVRQLAFHPDGQRLASAALSGSIQVWDVALGTSLFQLPGPALGADRLHFDPDGTRLIALDTGVSIRQWEAGLGPRHLVLPDTIDRWPYHAFAPDGQTLVAATRDETFRLWNLRTGTEVRTFAGASGSGVDAAFSPDGTRLAGTSLHSGVHVWEVATGKQLWQKRVPKDRDWTTRLTFSPDGATLAAGTSSGEVHLFDAATGRAGLVFPVQKDRVKAMAFSPDGYRIITVGARSVAVWESRTGKVVWSRQIPDILGAEEVFFDAAGKILGMRLDLTGSVLALDLATGNPAPAEPLVSAPRAVGTSPDGSLFARGDPLQTFVLGQVVPRERARSAFRNLPSPEWHREQARWSAATGQFSAAGFHLGVLANLSPWNVALRWEEARAWSRAGEPTFATRATLQALLVDPTWRSVDP
jgi:WD40 repeat protein